MQAACSRSCFCCWRPKGGLPVHFPTLPGWETSSPASSPCRWHGLRTTRRGNISQRLRRGTCSAPRISCWPLRSAERRRKVRPCRSLRRLRDRRRCNNCHGRSCRPSWCHSGWSCTRSSGRSFAACGRREARKSETEFETRGLVHHLDFRAVQVRNGRHETQAQSVAGGATAALEPIETLEYVLTFVAGDSRAVIDHRNDRAILALFDPHDDAIRRAAVLDGVVDQVGYCVEQKIAIADHRRAVISSRLQMATPVLRRSVEQFDDLARDLGQVDGAKRRRPIARLDLRDTRERGE